MKLPLAYYGNPILRKKATLIESITPELEQLIADMVETMMAFKGIGLAAPQVNRSLAVFIACFIEEEEKIDPSKIRTFINPKILSYSPEQADHSEGCLSIPKIYRDVRRPLSIHVAALDLKGNAFTEEFHGYDARIILHELDHLHGVLFIDRLPGKERKALEIQLRAIKKKYSLL